MVAWRDLRGYKSDGVTVSLVRLRMVSLSHPLLDRPGVSRHLRDTHGIVRSPQTLAVLACRGGGPAFRRFGRKPLYSIADVDAWVAERLSAPVRSTSEFAA